MKIKNYVLLLNLLISGWCLGSSSSNINTVEQERKSDSDTSDLTELLNVFTKELEAAQSVPLLPDVGDSSLPTELENIIFDYAPTERLSDGDIQELNALLVRLSKGRPAPYVMSTGAILPSVFGHQSLTPQQKLGNAGSMKLSRDGNYLITIGNAARIWQLRDGAWVETQTLGSVDLAAFSPDGKYLMTEKFGEKAKIWQLLDGTWVEMQLLAEIPGLLVGYLSGLEGAFPVEAFSHDGNYLATTKLDGNAQIWQLQNGTWREMQILKGTRFAMFSPAGNYLMTLMYGGAKIWQLQGGAWREMQTLKGVHHVYFSRDGNYLTALMGNGTKILQLQGGVWVEMKTFESAQYASVSPDGNSLIVCMRNDIKIWQLQDGAWREKQTLGGVNFAMFSPDGQYLLATRSGYNAQMWRLQDGAWKGLAILEGYQGAITRGPFFSSDGTQIFTGTKDGVHVYDLAVARFPVSQLTRLAQKLRAEKI